jgi:predicted nucleotidyltransferase
MVRVLSYDELARIPSPESLEKVLSSDVTHLINSLEFRDLISGAVAYGSVTRGEHSETSDIDVLVRYRTPDVLDELRATRCLIREEEGIVVEFSVFSDRLASTPFHRAAFSYINHVRANPAEKLVFGKDPLENFYSDDAQSSDDRIVYANGMGSHIDTLAKRYLEAHDNDVRYKHFLKGLIEKPTHFVREAVQLIHDGLPEESGRTIDSNRELSLLFAQHFGEESDISRGFSTINRTIAHYKDYIRNIRIGAVQPNAKSHKECLARIENLFSLEFQVMEQTCLVLNTQYLKR